MKNGAGGLDRRIIILRAVTVNDAFNEPIETWRVLAQVAASKRDIGDSERIRAGEAFGSKMTRFVIRYSSVVADLNPKDRVSFENRIYDINAVKEIGRREGFEITASARAD